MSSLLSQVASQVDYYFGDANVRKDRNLRAKIEKDKFVPISFVFAFPKLKELTNGQDSVVVDALQAHKSEIVELSSDCKSISRLHALPKKQEAIEVCVFLSGLPLEYSMEDVSKYIKQQFEVEPLLIKMRKENFKFVGECFVELADAEQVRVCVEKMKDNVVQCVPMGEWMQQFKEAQIATVRKFQSKSSGEDEVKNSCLRIDGLAEKCTLEQVKRAMTVPAVFVDFKQGDSRCLARFAGVEECDLAMENVKSSVAANELPGNSNNVMVTKLQGTEEDAFLARTLLPEKPAGSRDRTRDDRGRGGGRGGGGGFRGGGGRGGGFRGGNRGGFDKKRNNNGGGDFKRARN